MNLKRKSLLIFLSSFPLVFIVVPIHPHLSRRVGGGARTAFAERGGHDIGG